MICCIEPQKIPSAGYSSCCANGSQFRLVMHTEHAGVEPTFRGQLHDFFHRARNHLSVAEYAVSERTVARIARTIS